MYVEGRLELAPEPTSVRQARRLVHGLLQDAELEEWVHPVELALSELVTNVVLHAATPCEVRVRTDGTTIEARVRDYDLTLPRRPTPDAESVTGRGLSIVAELATRHGVTVLEDGKITWFVLEAVTDEDEGDHDRHTRVVHAALPADEDERVTVVLPGVPTALWRAAVEQWSAVVRELYLYLAGRAQRGEPVEVDLAPASSALRTLLAASTSDTLQDGRLELHLASSPVTARQFDALQDALDLGVQMARDERLLVRPALPEVVALRDWACEQVIAQLAGVPATAWPDSPHRHAADERTLGPAPAHPVPELELEGARRAAVAADETNRLVAANAAAAELLRTTVAELIGRRITSLMPERYRERHVAGFTRHLTSGRVSLLGRPVTVPVVDAEGREVLRRLLVQERIVRGEPRLYLAWLDPVEDTDPVVE